MTTVILTLVIFMFIILIHEFGHFITAKLCNVRVNEFSIGMGPLLLRKKKGDTQYSLRLLPIGGYVSMEGEDADSEDDRALNKKPLWQRLIIVSAGAMLNLLLGFVIIVILYSAQGTAPTINVESVQQGAPAYGVLQPGDRIVKYNGNRTWYYKNLNFMMSDNDGSPVTLEIERGEERFPVELTPQYNEEYGRYMIGVSFASENLNPLTILKYSFYEMFFVVKLVLYSLVMLVTGKVPLSQVSGPVGAGSMIGEAARAGFLTLLNISAILSINIGVFNLIPFPALDGGRIFFMLVELVRRKPIPTEKEGMVHFVGLVLLMVLMIVVTWNDLYKLIAPLFGG